MPLRRLSYVLLTFLLTQGGCNAIAQNKDCREVTAIAEMARSRSIASLNSLQQAAGETYLAHIVFAIRHFELQPKNTNSATELLKMIPSQDDEELAVKSLNGFLCDGEAMADVEILSRLSDRIARDFSRAVLVVPQKMKAYVVYAAEAVQDPHSDYALQMERVCRARHTAFLTAVENLGAGAPEKGHFATASTTWFRKHILDPETCRAIAIPEAE